MKDLVQYREQLIVHRIENPNPMKSGTELYVVPVNREIDLGLFESRGMGIASFLQSKGVSLEEAVRHFPGDIVAGPAAEDRDSWERVEVQRIPLNDNGLGRLSTIAGMPLSLYMSLKWPSGEMPRLIAQFIPHLQRPHRDYL